MHTFETVGRSCRLPILSVLLLLAAAAPAAEAPEAKYYRPPRSLKGDDGLTEFGLIDPFRRGDDRTPAKPSAEETDTSLQRTSMGELSDGFRILTIIVPKKDGRRKPAALIQLERNADPILVQEGDLVRIERKKSDKKNKTAVELALERYTFYLHIKRITSDGLEIYYNKKRPDDTMILRW